MKKFLIALLLLSLSINAEATVQWRNGTGANTLLGTSNASDIDTNTLNNIVKPIDDLVANYQQGMVITYSSASQISVASGSITVSNSDGSIRLMLRNSAATTVTWSDIDTGAEASSTTYYVYAIAASASATTATFKISASSTSPSGVTYYKKIGTFYNDSSSNISRIDNDILYAEIGEPTSKTAGTTYQALTDGFITGNTYTASQGNGFIIYSDSTSSPSTIVERCQTIWVSGGIDTRMPFFYPVKKGDYYTVVGLNYVGSTDNSQIERLNFIPLN